MKQQKSKTSLPLLEWMMDIGIMCKLGKFTVDCFYNCFKDHIGWTVSKFHRSYISLTMNDT